MSFDTELIRQRLAEFPDLNGNAALLRACDEIDSLLSQLEAARDALNDAAETLYSLKGALDSCKYGENYDWPDYAEKTLNKVDALLFRLPSKDEARLQGGSK